MATTAPEHFKAASTLGDLDGGSLPNIQYHRAKYNHLNDIDIMKSNIMTKINFEIRGSLNSILSSIDQLYDTNLTQDQADALNVVHQGSHDIMSILNDISDFTNIRSGNMKLDIATGNIKDIISFCIKIASSRDSKKNIKFNLGLAKNFSHDINTDIGLLKRVIIKLLLNSVKYSCTKSKIDIFIEPSNDLIKFSIIDKGSGISIEDQQLIFKKLKPNSTGSTGLSLIICKGIVEFMGGTMWFESIPGEGSKFYFTIKPTSNFDKHKQVLKHKTAVIISQNNQIRLFISKLLISLEVKVYLCINIEEAELYNDSVYPNFYISDQELIDQNKHIYIIKFYNENQLLSDMINYVSTTNLHTGIQCKILIADDYQTNIVSLSLHLKKLGYINIDIASDGKEAINLIKDKYQKHEKYDILFLDLVMPKLNGYEVMNIINKKYKKYKPYVIAVTADDSSKNKCESYKIDNYMIKPVSRDALKRVLSCSILT